MAGVTMAKVSAKERKAYKLTHPTPWISGTLPADATEKEKYYSLKPKQREEYKLTHPTPWLDEAAARKAEQGAYKVANPNPRVSATVDLRDVPVETPHKKGWFSWLFK